MAVPTTTTAAAVRPASGQRPARPAGPAGSVRPGSASLRGDRPSVASRYPLSLRMEEPPSRTSLVRELRRLGARHPHLLIDRYGLRDVAAALYYVLSQRGRYQPRNPGGLVTWLVEAYHRRKLQGWQLQRILGFVRRFSSAPAWVRMRLRLWARNLQRFWLGAPSWRRLLRCYGNHVLEDAFLRQPQADLWRAVRYLLYHHYRPLPSQLDSLLSQGASYQGRQQVIAWAREEEFIDSLFGFEPA